VSVFAIVYIHAYIHIHRNTHTVIHTYTTSGVVATRAVIGSLSTVAFKNCFDDVNLGQSFLLSEVVATEKHY